MAPAAIASNNHRHLPAPPDQDLARQFRTHLDLDQWFARISQERVRVTPKGATAPPDEHDDHHLLILN